MIAGSDQVYLRGVSSFARHLVIEERVDGLDQIRLRTYEGDEHRVAFPEASYTAGLGTNPEFDSPDYRIGYASMVTPDTVYDYDSGGAHAHRPQGAARCPRATTPASTPPSG